MINDNVDNINIDFINESLTNTRQCQLILQVHLLFNLTLNRQTSIYLKFMTGHDLKQFLNVTIFSATRQQRKSPNISTSLRHKSSS